MLKKYYLLCQLTNYLMQVAKFLTVCIPTYEMFFNTSTWRNICSWHSLIHDGLEVSAAQMLFSRLSNHRDIQREIIYNDCSQIFVYFIFLSNILLNTSILTLRTSKLPSNNKNWCTQVRKKKKKDSDKSTFIIYQTSVSNYFLEI